MREWIDICTDNKRIIEMWTGSLYQFVLPPAEKGEAIIIIGIRRRTREIRVSSIIVSRTPAPCVCVWFIRRTFVYAYTHVARAFFFLLNWIALSAFRSLTLSSSHQGPTDNPAVPMSHTPARLRTSLTLTPRRSTAREDREKIACTVELYAEPPHLFMRHYSAHISGSRFTFTSTPQKI